MVAHVGLLDGVPLHFKVQLQQEMIIENYSLILDAFCWKNNQTTKNFKLLVLMSSQIPIVPITQLKILSSGH